MPIGVTGLLEMKENTNKFTQGLVLWRKAMYSFFGLEHLKISSAEIKILKSLWGMVSEDEFLFNLFLLMYEYKFTKWYRQRQLVPSLFSLSKNWNRLSLMQQKFLNLFELYKKNKDFYNFLGLQPFVIIEDNKVPFGLNLPVDIRNKGYQMRDIIRIEGRRLILIDFNGDLFEVMGYCHFGYKVDNITQEFVESHNEVLWVELDKVKDVHLRLWFNKDLLLQDARKEIECLLKD
jgi:hypothetical protein